MNLVAIIPARSGSIRIPHKNIKLFRGKPIISYSIETAQKSKLFNEIMVSTDDREIEKISRSFGAKVPFLRSKKTANEYATIADVIEEVLNEYKKIGKEFDYCCCILATAILLTPQRLIEGFDLLRKKNYDTVFPVVRFSYPIQRGFEIEDSKASMIWPEFMNKRSQDLLPSYHDSGQFYWIKTSEFLKKKKIFTENSGAIELSEYEVQDIDTETDWKLAEMKYKIIFEKHS